MAQTLQTQTIPTFTDLQNQAMQKLYNMYSPEEAQSLWSRIQSPELERVNNIALGRLKQAYGPQGYQGSPYKMAVQRQMQDYTRSADSSLAQSLQNYAQLKGNAMGQIIQASPQQTLAYWENPTSSTPQTGVSGGSYSSYNDMLNRLNTTGTMGTQAKNTTPTGDYWTYGSGYYQNPSTENTGLDYDYWINYYDQIEKARAAEAAKYNPEIAARDAQYTRGLGDYSSLNNWTPDLVGQPSALTPTQDSYGYEPGPYNPLYYGWDYGNVY